MIVGMSSSEKLAYRIWEGCFNIKYAIFKQTHLMTDTVHSRYRAVIYPQ